MGEKKNFNNKNYDESKLVSLVISMPIEMLKESGIQDAQDIRIESERGKIIIYSNIL